MATAEAKPLDPHNLMELQTAQSHAFRTLIEALKDVLAECVWTFSASGVKVLAMDPSHQVLCQLRLDGDKFDRYFCPQTLRLGINMIHFHKLIKTMTNNDTLTLFVDERDMNRLGIRIENAEKNTVTTFRFAFMDLNDEDVDLPPAQFSSVVTLSSLEFCKIVRDSHSIADTVEIKSVGQQMIFSCKGEFASQQTIIGSVAPPNEDGTPAAAEDTEIVQGHFSLKYLSLFTRCTSLSQQVELYIKNDFPIVISLNCASLGVIRLALCPLSSMDNS